MRRYLTIILFMVLAVTPLMRPSTTHSLSPSSLAQGTWTAKAPMSVPRDRPAAVVLDGKIHVIGGNNSGGALASMEVYDPATNTWSTKASMPGPKSKPGAAMAASTWSGRRTIAYTSTTRRPTLGLPKPLYLQLLLTR